MSHEKTLELVRAANQLMDMLDQAEVKVANEAEYARAKFELRYASMDTWGEAHGIVTTFYRDGDPDMPRTIRIKADKS